MLNADHRAALEAMAGTSPEVAAALGEIDGLRRPKCLFCAFTGSAHELRNHSQDCPEHPAVKRMIMARAHWNDAQQRLSTIERRLIEMNGGNECGIWDSLDVIAQQLADSQRQLAAVIGERDALLTALKFPKGVAAQLPAMCDKLNSDLLAEREALAASESLCAQLRGALDAYLGWQKAVADFNLKFEREEYATVDDSNQVIAKKLHFLQLLNACNKTSTSSAALAARDAEVRRACLEEVKNLIQQTTPECVNQLNDYSFGKFEGRIYAIEQIESMINPRPLMSDEETAQPPADGGGDGN